MEGEREEAVAAALNAINKANLGGVVEEGAWRTLVDEYFLFAEDELETPDQDLSSEEGIDEPQDSLEPEDDEDEPLVITDPSEQILKDEREQCEKFRYVV